MIKNERLRLKKYIALLRLDHAPAWWNITSDEEIIHQAIFLIPPATIDEVYTAVGEAKPEGMPAP